MEKEAKLQTVDLGLDKRKYVLGTALMMESLTSSFLIGLLDIKDARNSRCFGNKSSALSFNQKIDLLIDLGALEVETKTKFLTFMEIRNQFMHNLDAVDYEKCYSYLPGKDKYILKTYPQSGAKSREESLELATKAMISDVLGITTGLTKALKEKFRARAEADVSKQSNEAFAETVPEVQKILNDYIDKINKEGKEVMINKFKDFGTEVGKIIYSVWNQKFKEIVDKERTEKEAHRK